MGCLRSCTVTLTVWNLQDRAGYVSCFFYWQQTPEKDQNHQCVKNASPSLTEWEQYADRQNAKKSKITSTVAPHSTSSFMIFKSCCVVMSAKPLQPSSHGLFKVSWAVIPPHHSVRKAQTQNWTHIRHALFLYVTPIMLSKLPCEIIHCKRQLSSVLGRLLYKRIGF